MRWRPALAVIVRLKLPLRATVAVRRRTVAQRLPVLRWRTRATLPEVAPATLPVTLTRRPLTRAMRAEGFLRDVVAVGVGTGALTGVGVETGGATGVGATGVAVGTGATGVGTGATGVGTGVPIGSIVVSVSVIGAPVRTSTAPEAGPSVTEVRATP